MESLAKRSLIVVINLALIAGVFCILPVTSFAEEVEGVVVESPIEITESITTVDVSVPDFNSDADVEVVQDETLVEEVVLEEDLIIENKETSSIDESSIEVETVKESDDDVDIVEVLELEILEVEEANSNATTTESIVNATTTESIVVEQQQDLDFKADENKTEVSVVTRSFPVVLAESEGNNNSTTELVISPEVDLNTSNDNGGGEDETAISEEVSITTSGNTDPTLEEIAISSEISFITESDVDPTPTEIAISSELFFNTISASAEEIAISDEITFTTEDNGGGPTPTEIAISDQFSFSTNVAEIAIGDEMSFTTDDDGGNGGGGGGGGGGGHRRDRDDEIRMCVPYLKSFIKLGANNPPEEVIKLKAFLNSFEGFNLPLTPIYDEQTFLAVEVFQLRHASDVLDPWDIDGPTGFVYITTSLKINYIVCGITAPIDMTLLGAEDFIRLVPAAADVLKPGEILVPTASGEVGLIDQEFGLPELLAIFRIFNGDNNVNRNSNLAGIGFLGNFEDLCWLCWLLVLILSILLIYMIYRNHKLKKAIGYKNDQIMYLQEKRHLNAGPIPMPSASSDEVSVPEDLPITETEDTVGKDETTETPTILAGEGDDLEQKDTASNKEDLK